MIQIIRDRLGSRINLIISYTICCFGQILDISQECESHQRLGVALDCSVHILS